MPYVCTLPFCISVLHKVTVIYNWSVVDYMALFPSTPYPMTVVCIITPRVCARGKVIGSVVHCPHKNHQISSSRCLREWPALSQYQKLQNNSWTFVSKCLIKGTNATNCTLFGHTYWSHLCTVQLCMLELIIDKGHQVIHWLGLQLV